ncbi:MAG: glycerol-3-phosphate acyltransferase, partial [Clostridia bacterium]|nr:glycerol-3-phosphate acyltransferase [Clostridia bacterium]
YFCGNISFARMISTFKKGDITKMGSGNPGAIRVQRNFFEGVSSESVYGSFSKGFWKGSGETFLQKGFPGKNIQSTWRFLWLSDRFLCLLRIRRVRWPMRCTPCPTRVLSCARCPLRTPAISVFCA